MTDLTFESGKLTAVYYNIGRREDRTNKLMRANFDVLDWGVSSARTDRYAVPLGIERITNEDLNDPLTPSDAREAIDVGQEFGFYQAGEFIIETHDGNGGDSFFGVHSFGLL
jgi:hypothetical protein